MLDDVELDDENARDDLSDEYKNNDEDNIDSNPAISSTAEGEM